MQRSTVAPLSFAYWLVWGTVIPLLATQLWATLMAVLEWLE